MTHVLRRLRPRRGDVTRGSCGTFRPPRDPTRMSRHVGHPVAAVATWTASLQQGTAVIVGPPQH
eukprot:scaffold2144_cov334-Prasinococcus_capsulatus_cf.AAC.14